MNPTTLDVNVITQFSSLGQRLSKGVAEGAQALLLRASSMAQDFNRQAEEIRKSDALTEVGKRAELKKLYTGVTKQLEALYGEAEGYTRNADSIAAKMQPKAGNVPTEERIITEMRRREIRDAIRARQDYDPTRLGLAYKAAIKEGDDEFALAVEESPRSFSMISEQLRAEGVQARLERQNPDAAAQVAELRAAHESVKYVLDEITKGSQKLAGIADTSLDALAGGE